MAYLAIAGEEDDDAAGLDIKPKNAKAEPKKQEPSESKQLRTQPAENSQQEQDDEIDPLIQQINQSSLTDIQKEGMKKTYRSLTGDSKMKFAEVVLEKIKKA